MRAVESIAFFVARGGKVDGATPDRDDLIGAAIASAGVTVIMDAPSE